MAEKTDRELVRLAAKAAGIKGDVEELWTHPGGDPRATMIYGLFNEATGEYWEPLTDDGDALRLAVKLHLEIDHNHKLDNDMWVMASPNGLMAGPSVEIEDEADRYAATRRAIVRAAAAVGEGM